MSWSNEELRKGAIVRFEGNPNDPAFPREEKRWRRFCRMLLPWLKKGGTLAVEGTDLAREFAIAEIAKRNNEASKLAAEASSISADADLKRHEKVKAVNLEIARIFEGDAPGAAKALQLGNLLEANPNLAKQAKKVADLLRRLHDERGVIVQMASDVQPSTVHRTPNTPAVLDKLISDVQLSARSRLALKKANIRTLRDLTEVSEEELLSLANFGPTSLSEIKQILQMHDLVLKQQP